MTEGNVDGTVFNGVSDIQLLTLGDGGPTASPTEPATQSHIRAEGRRAE